MSELNLKINDMPENVFDGRLGEICANDLRSFPRAYAWPALVTVASGAVPSMFSVRTNIYCALVGPVHTGKTLAIDRSIQTLRLREPVLMREMAGSAEGLLKFMGNANGDARLFFPDELSHLLEKAAIDRASFPYVLNTAYNKTNFGVIMAKQKRVPFNCRLSVVGGIVHDNFQKSFAHSTTGGLHDRFIFGLCPAPYEFAYRPLTCQPKACKPVVVSIESDVWSALDEWRTEGLVGRVAENAIRVATICASFSGLKSLRASDLGPALAFAKYQFKVTRFLQPNPGEGQDARCAFSVMNLLQLSPLGKWFKKRDLYHAINASRYGPGAFDRALRNLELNGEIEVDLGTRPYKLRLMPEEK